MDIKWVGANTGNFQAGRPGGFHPEAIVIHIMDGTLGGTDSWFNDPRAKVSAHYGVGKDGDVHQYVKETDTAYHAGTVVSPTWRLLKPRVNPNFYTIGIEHEGLASDPYPWPDAQLAASLSLVRTIAGRWSISLDADHVVPHHEIRANKTCPGDNFNLDDYVGRLAGVEPAPAQPAEPAASDVTAVADINVRAAPTTATAVIRTLSKDAVWHVTGLVRNGEAVSGNALWYAGDGRQFIWAGATDKPNGI